MSNLDHMACGALGEPAAGRGASKDQVEAGRKKLKHSGALGEPAAGRGASKDQDEAGRKKRKHSGALGEPAAGRGASKVQDEARRKKHNEACKRYRKNFKEHEEMLKADIGVLNSKIAKADMTIGSLDMERSMLSEKLEFFKIRKAELKVQVGENEKVVANQNQQLEELSKHPNLKLGSGIPNIEKLKNEHAVLNERELDTAVLKKEISELKEETIKLKTHWRVLAEKSPGLETANPSEY